MVIGLAHDLRLRTAADGIESEPPALARAAGLQRRPGQFISAPLDGAGLRAMLQATETLALATGRTGA
ncbi:MAG TPA: hypothetical protein VJ724_01545 [Tahibacter sp.]|nr:hypothetical protein [Tahibacter sp.]